MAKRSPKKAPPARAAAETKPAVPTPEQMAKMIDAMGRKILSVVLGRVRDETEVALATVKADIEAVKARLGRIENSVHLQPAPRAEPDRDSGFRKGPPRPERQPSEGRKPMPKYKIVGGPHNDQVVSLELVGNFQKESFEVQSVEIVATVSGEKRIFRSDGAVLRDAGPVVD